MLAHFLWLSKWCWRGKSFSIKCHTFCHLYLSVVISCFHLENVKSFSSPSFLALLAPLLTLSLLLPVSLSFSSLLNALFSNSEFFPLLVHFLLFDITPFVPVVSGPALPGGDRFSHSHSDVTQSISEGDKLSFKLLSVLKWKRKMKGEKSQAEAQTPGSSYEIKLNERRENKYSISQGEQRLIWEILMTQTGCFSL